MRKKIYSKYLSNNSEIKFKQLPNPPPALQQAADMVCNYYFLAFTTRIISMSKISAL